MKRTWGLVAIAIILACTSAAAIDELPVPDGAYLSEDHCDLAEIGELDMVGFSVEKGGREIGTDEAYCMVATVTTMRENRYAVSSDCLEFGEPFQSNYILDVLGEGHIRVDGQDLYRCTNGFLAETSTIPANVAQLIELWLEEAKSCSGPGDNPATDEACGRRNQVILDLNMAGYCYGKGEQSRAEFEWHPCEADSIREQ